MCSAGSVSSIVGPWLAGQPNVCELAQEQCGQKFFAKFLEKGAENAKISTSKLDLKAHNNHVLLLPV